MESKDISASQENPIIKYFKTIPGISIVIVLFMLSLIAYIYLLINSTVFATYYLEIGFSFLGAYCVFLLAMFILELRHRRSELTVTLSYVGLGLAIFHLLMTIYWAPEWGGENTLKACFYNFHLIGGVIIIVIDRKIQKYLGTTLEVNRLEALPVTGIVFTIISMLFHGSVAFMKFLFTIPGLS